AERFARNHGDRLRFVHQTAMWHTWDGRRWVADRDGLVGRLAVETVRAIYREAACAAERSDREELALHAVRSEGHQRIKAMLEHAKSTKPIATVPEAFDRPETAYVINVENGTLDLRSGALRQHDPHDFITKLASVAYDPDARSPAWDQFLEKQVPDPE